jgi:hypothetical protein
LQSFTLAEEIAKQRQHLQLHVDHHRNLKAKAEALHRSIKEQLPAYL